MVDSINNIGGIQGVNSANKSQNPQRSEQKRENGAVQDEVSISSEALNLAQAEQVASDVRAQLTQNQDLSLGLTDGFDERV